MRFLPDYFKISRDLEHIFHVQAAGNLIPDHPIKRFNGDNTSE